MSSLKADFDELRERIRHGRELGHASFEPIYYLVFPPEQILEVKRQTPAWVAKLHQEGWNVHTFSIAEQIWALLKDDPFMWSLCVTEDKAAPLNWPRTNKALADILTADSGLLKRLEAPYSRSKASRTRCSWSPTLRHCTRFCALAPSKASSKANFTCRRFFCTPACEPARRA